MAIVNIKHGKITSTLEGLRVGSLFIFASLTSTIDVYAKVSENHILCLTSDTGVEEIIAPSCPVHPVALEACTIRYSTSN